MLTFKERNADSNALLLRTIRQIEGNVGGPITNGRGLKFGSGPLVVQQSAQTLVLFTLFRRASRPFNHVSSGFQLALFWSAKHSS